MKKPRPQLTHALLYEANRWRCKCGYVMGDGHDKLYALCPLSLRDKARRPESVISNSIELNPLGKRRRRSKPAAPAKPLKEGVLDAFDI